MRPLTISTPIPSGIKLVQPLQERFERGRSACLRLTLTLATVVPGVAFAVALFSLFGIAGTDAALAPLAALAGTASLGYLGTALLSGNTLRAALDQLPPDYREVIRLRNWQQLSFVRIGERIAAIQPLSRRTQAKAQGTATASHARAGIDQ